MKSTPVCRQLVYAAVVIGAMAAAAGADAVLKVACSTTDLAAVTRAVGGDAVQVSAIAKGPQDPHYVQARPSTMRLLNKADLLVYNGLQLEIGWLPLLIEGARNPRLADPATGQLDASSVIEPMEIPTSAVDRSMGDVHPEGNPHYTLDPRNAARIAELVAQRLIELMPDQAVPISTRLQRFVLELAVRQAAWEQRAAPWRGRALVSYHKQFEYLADWLGLQVVAYVEHRPGIPPTPRHLRGLIDRMASDDIDIVLVSTFSDVAKAQRFAERSGARLVVLPAAVDAVEGTADYGQLLNTIMARLARAFAETDRGD